MKKQLALILCFLALTASEALAQHVRVRGYYLRSRIAHNEGNLHEADSIFTVRYGSRYTSPVKEEIYLTTTTRATVSPPPALRRHE